MDKKRTARRDDTLGEVTAYIQVACQVCRGRKVNSYSERKLNERTTATMRIRLPCLYAGHAAVKVCSYVFQHTAASASLPCAVVAVRFMPIFCTASCKDCVGDGRRGFLKAIGIPVERDAHALCHRLEFGHT
jgi:hypothetical protein